MKKKFLFIFSLSIAVFIYIAVKSTTFENSERKKEVYKTYVKNQNQTIASYKTTKDEFKRAAITDRSNDRSPAEEDKNSDIVQANPKKNGRIIFGTDANKYINDSDKIEMQNKVNKDWKELLGLDLLRFQKEDTKVIIKEEFSMIKVQENKGLFVEQVIVTYLLKNGDRMSYRALVDSETGLVLETWDRTIHERMRKGRADLGAIPLKVTE